MFSVVVVVRLELAVIVWARWWLTLWMVVHLLTGTHIGVGAEWQKRWGVRYLYPNFVTKNYPGNASIHFLPVNRRFRKLTYCSEEATTQIPPISNSPSSKYRDDSWYSKLITNSSRRRTSQSQKYCRGWPYLVLIQKHVVPMTWGCVHKSFQH